MITDELIDVALAVIREEALRREVYVCIECISITLAKRLESETDLERAALLALDDALAMGKENGL